MLIVLHGNPLSTNHVYPTGCFGGRPRTYMSKNASTLKENYQLEAKYQYNGKPYQNSIFAQIRLYFGDKRRRDIDNYHKLSLDALTGIAWEDDSQIQRMIIEKFYDKENPRIEIEFEDI